MDRLSHVARLIADIRLGADRLLEALLIAAQPHQSNKPLHMFLKEDSSMCQHLHDLRSIIRVSSFLKLCFLIYSRKAARGI
nr:mediator of rna polymerase ii transcription subunit 27 [Quercus suber]POE95938.1 mediator of rna polymerase ii transcription subunit 27 [Quercus suber]